MGGHTCDGQDKDARKGASLTKPAGRALLCDPGQGPVQGAQQTEEAPDLLIPWLDALLRLVERQDPGGG